MNQSLQHIVDTLCLKTGLTLDDVDTSALADIDVQGYSIGAATSAEAALQQIMQLFQLYCTETGDKLKFARLADSPNAGTVSLDDCGVRQDASLGGGVVSVRAETALPRKLELRFSDPALEYRENVAAAYRLTARSERAEVIQAPLVVPHARAEQICRAALELAWTAQTTTEVQVPVAYSHVEAGDTVELDGSLWHVTRVQFSAPLAIKLSLARFSYAAVSRVTAPTVAEPVVAPIVVRDQPVAVPLDVQLLSADTDYSGLYLVAYAPAGKSCGPAATLAIQNADGEYEAGATVPVGAVVGSTVTTMAPGTATVYEAGDTFEVRLESTGSLAGCTLDAALAGKNRALVGNELVAFTGCAYNAASGSYTLTGLVRGLGGTAPGAEAGARFVLLQSTMVADVPLPFEQTGRVLTCKLLGATAPEATAAEFTLVNTNQRLRPLCPVHLTSELSEGVATLHWTRQARKNYEMMDGTDVPLDFVRERYEVELLGAGGAVVATHSIEAPFASVALESATHWRVRQLGDLLPGAWSTIEEL